MAPLGIPKNVARAVSSLPIHPHKLCDYMTVEGKTLIELNVSKSRSTEIVYFWNAKFQPILPWGLLRTRESDAVDNNDIKLKGQRVRYSLGRESVVVGQHGWRLNVNHKTWMKGMNQVGQDL